MNDENKRMPAPSTDLDLQSQTLQPYISSEFVDARFRKKFIDASPVMKVITNKVGEPLKDEHGNERQELVLDNEGRPLVKVQKDLWSILQIFNQDLRLGNLTKEEALYVEYHIDVACDILICYGDEGREAALMCLERAICRNEVSQGKYGFLRKLLNTFIQKTTQNTDVNKKGRLMSFNRNKT